MRLFNLFIFCFVLFSSVLAQPKDQAKKFPVSGTITSTSNYCGGAQPTEEMLAEMATPKAVPNKKIYIKKGEINSFHNKVFLELTADTLGNFYTTLPPGKYLVVDKDKKDRAYYNKLLKEHLRQTEHYDAVDSVCLKEWYLKPDFTFEVGNKEVKNINVNYQNVCFDLPCTRFRGPFPP